MPVTGTGSTRLETSLNRRLSEGEREELAALGVLSSQGAIQPAPPAPVGPDGPVEKHAIRAGSVLNEAYDYARPSSFTRGIRVDVGDKALLLISGTASINDGGETVHAGDFRAQLWRTYRNISALLESEGATWHDIVRTTCYLRDIERDYRDFNEVRTAFFDWLGLNPLPASTGIQARLCREDLLVEIEAIAIVPRGGRR
jgi:2-iminobutanoate/2-iminopropanoate deaminase